MPAYRDAEEQYGVFRDILTLLFREYLLWQESPTLPAHPTEWELPILMQRLQTRGAEKERVFTLTEQGREQYRALRRKNELQAAEADCFLPLEYIGKSLGIPWQGQLMVMCAFWAACDEDFSVILRYCNRGNLSSPLLGGLTALQLFYGGDKAGFRQAREGYLPLVFSYDQSQTCLEQTFFTLRPRVLELLLGGPILKNFAWADSYHIFEELPPLYGREEQMAYLTRAFTDGTPGKVILQGEPGSGRLFLLRHVCRQIRRNLLMVSWSGLLEQPWPEALHTLAGEILLQRAVCCLTDFRQSPDPARLKEMEIELGAAAPVLAFRLEPGITLPRDDIRRRFVLGELDSSANRLLWESGPLPLREPLAGLQLAGKYHFLPGKIVRILSACAEQCGMEGARQIPLEQVERVCLDRTGDGMGDGAIRLDTGYTMEDLILPPEEKRQLQEGMDHIRYHYQVFEQWNFKKKLRYGQGLSMLFEGPPGTGKTMAASIIGNELGLPVFQVDLSRVMSKYIGETEKSLGRMFDLAERSNAILFFDDTDALFGKRGEIKDSHDKYANVETSFLLQKMEEYRGVVVMTTNLLANIDTAFLRRISYIIHFPSPDAERRGLLWRGAFPDEAPVDSGVDFAFLAEHFEMTGAMIKSAAVSAAFLAAAQDRPIEMRDLLSAVQKQFRKYGKRLGPDEFGPYGIYFRDDTRR